jgi:hypothetical protein
VISFQIDSSMCCFFLKVKIILFPYINILNYNVFDKKFEIRIKNKVDEYKTKKIDSSFEKFTLNEINQELKKLKKRSAMGNDKIHNLFLTNTSF